MKLRNCLLIGTILASAVASAGFVDRPSGIRIGQRMTLRPYVAFYYTWDSNVTSEHSSNQNSSFNINPGFTATYKAENWNISGGAYYQYHLYFANSKNLNQHSFGENLAFNYSNSRDGGPGWSLVIRENLSFIAQDDDMSNERGRGAGRNRWQAQLAGTLQRRFTERFHGDVNASFYYIDYANDVDSYAPLYGWSRYTVGAQAGYALSKWTDFILTGTYQGYFQDNDTDLGGTGEKQGRNIGAQSDGFTIHAGVGSYATDKISYRLTGGWSSFRYGNGAARSNGFTYTASANWRITDNWNMMLMGSSYYHPSEVDYGAFSRTDQISWGLAHSMVRNKLNATLDLAYNHQQREYTEYYTDDVTENTLTGRLGLNYTLNRFFSIFGRLEYQLGLCDGPYVDGKELDYDRWRLSVGIRLTY